jgi:hypothetical protein
MQPSIVLANFDRRQVESIAAGKAICCSYHAALAASLSEPWHGAIYLAYLRTKSYCRKEVIPDEGPPEAPAMAA